MDIHILTTFKTENKTNRAICQNNECIFQENKELQVVRTVKMIVYQSNIYRKNFSRSHFYYNSMVQGKQQVFDQHSYILVSLTCLIYQSRRQSRS